MLEACSGALRAIEVVRFLNRNLALSWRRSQVVLFDLIEQGLVTDLQVAGGGFAVPPGALQRLRDRGSLSTAFEVSDEMLEASFVI